MMEMSGRGRSKVSVLIDRKNWEGSEVVCLSWYFGG